MDPLTMLAIGSGLSSLFGAFGAGSAERHREKKLGQIYSPETFGRYQQAFYNQFLGSPTWQQMQANIYGGANQFQQDFTRRMLAQGMGGGLQNLSQALAGSYVFGQKNQALSAADVLARQQAGQTLQGYGSAIAGTPLPPTGWETLNAGLGGLNQMLLLRALSQPPQPKAAGALGSGGSTAPFAPSPWWGRINLPQTTPQMPDPWRAYGPGFGIFR